VHDDAQEDIYVFSIFIIFSVFVELGKNNLWTL